MFYFSWKQCYKNILSNLFYFIMTARFKLNIKKEHFESKMGAKKKDFLC